MRILETGYKNVENKKSGQELKSSQTSKYQKLRGKKLKC